MTTCRSCDADVVFVPSATTGKSMILDAQPEKRVVMVNGSESLGVFRNRVLFKDALRVDIRATVVDVYTDHHATCPDAAAWKGKKR